MLKDKRLSYEMVIPFKHWIISYISRKLEFEIHFKTRFKTSNFGKDSSASWHQHFESSGEIEGQLNFKGNDPITIKGYGQRDKSWGHRDWHEFDKWYAGHFQFKNWSCAFRQDFRNECVDLTGHIYNAEELIPITL